MARNSKVALLVIGCCLYFGTASERENVRRGDDESKKVLLPHHSFVQPLEYRILLEDWVVSGASLFERDRLAIHPQVPKVAGFAWNKRGILSNNFEVLVHFRIAGDRERSSPSDQSFGVWYVEQNISQVYDEARVIKATSWEAGLEEQGMTFAGMKAQFPGIGVILAASGGSRKPVVSFVSNDGSERLDEKTHLPSRHSKEIDYRNTLNPAQLRIRVKGDLIEGFLKQSPSLAWNECFAVKRYVKAGGFLGFTAWSGGVPDSAALPDLVSITEVDVYNLDETSIGEDMPDVSKDIQAAYRDMLTDDKRHFNDQKAQTDHLARLVKTLEDHIADSLPGEEKLLMEMQGLSARIDRLAAGSRELKRETHLLLGNVKGKVRVNDHETVIMAMRKELRGLGSLLGRDSAVSSKAVRVLQRAVTQMETASPNGDPETVKRLSDQVTQMSETVSSRGSQSTKMIIGLVIAIAIIGYLIYTRMHYYEKKHFQ